MQLRTTRRKPLSEQKRTFSEDSTRKVNYRMERMHGWLVLQLSNGLSLMEEPQNCHSRCDRREEHITDTPHKYSSRRRCQAQSLFVPHCKRTARASSCTLRASSRARSVQSPEHSAETAYFQIERDGVHRAVPPLRLAPSALDFDSRTQPRASNAAILVGYRRSQHASSALRLERGRSCLSFLSFKIKKEIFYYELLHGCTCDMQRAEIYIIIN